MSFKSILGATRTCQTVITYRIQQILWGTLLTGFLGCANAANFTVNQTFDGADANPGDGLCATGGGSCTLRAAVMETNALAGADSISIPAGTYSIALGNTGEDAAAEGDLDILDDLTITGADAATTTINGNSFSFRIFSILKRADDSLPVVAINKLTLTQGLSDVDGALVYNAGELSLDDITLTDASPDSRAVVNEGNFTMSNSRVSGNAMGILSIVSASRLTITSSIFTNNVGVDKGSAIMYGFGRATISDTKFLDNEGHNGGAIYTTGGSLTIRNCLFERNKANAYAFSGGGALVLGSGKLIIESSTFDNNSANGAGGALELSGGGSSIMDAVFTNNIAETNGGGIYSTGTLGMKRVTISGNQAVSGDGGGIYAGILFVFAESIISNNRAGGLGGGAFLSSRSDSNVFKNIEISNNTALSGGGVFVLHYNGVSNTVTLENTSISNNIATGPSGGGGLYNKLSFSGVGLIELIHVTIANNTSPDGTGSNLANESGTVRIYSTLIANPVGNTNCSGSITTLGYNLSSDSSCGLGVEGDQSSVDPLLDVLADNGGFNKTLALMTGSPAIDAGSAAFCTTLDQRYYYREDASCDTGAYESGSSVRINPGMISFSSAEYSVNEGDDAITITFSRTGGNEGAVSLDYFDGMFGTAKSGGPIVLGVPYFPFDYTIIPTTLEWLDGDSNDKTIEISIREDDTLEGDETFLLELDTEVFVSGDVSLGISAATVTIIDNDVPGEIQFSNASYTVSEDGNFASIIVERINGNTAVSVDYVTSDGTAVAGTDYNVNSGTLNFSTGETSKTFSVDITDNALTDGNRTINLTLSNPQGGLVLGAPVIAVLTIEDDETGGGGSGGAGELLFANAEITVNETDGTVTITVNRINGSTGTVSVDYFANPTPVVPATSGSDYVLPNGTLTFADGVTSLTFALSITDDALLEGEEDFWIDLENPTGGAILGFDWYTLVTIIDDETGSGGGGGAGLECRAYAPNAGELRFDSDAMSVNEDAGSVTVTVNRTFGCTGTVGVDFNVYFPLFTGTASASKGSDFNLADGTLTFADGVTSQTITFSIINDTVSEGDEAFIIDLEFPTSGVSFGMESELTVTIIDDDSGSNSSTTNTDTNTSADSGSGSGGGGALNPLLLLGLILVPVIRRRKQR